MTDFTTRLPRAMYRAEQVRQLDALAIREYSVSGFTLMKRAAAAAFDVLLETWPQTRELVVFVGGGNNGGDGYVLAGLASDHELTVTVVVMHADQTLRGEAAEAEQFARDRDVTCCKFHDMDSVLQQAGKQTVLVDALFGTGLSRDIGGDFAQAIAAINATEFPVLSLDIPSGLNADTGNPMPCAVCADSTVTFVAMKQGMLTGQARNYVGTLRFASLDLPDRLYRDAAAPTAPVRRIDINDTFAALRPRPAASHKGSNGHALLIGGELGYGGAILMAAEAAARSGAGLTSVVSRSAHRDAMLARCPEVMFYGTEDFAGQGQQKIADLMQRASVITIGPGLGRSEWSRDLLQRVLAVHRRRSIPLVIDADALHLLAERREVDAMIRRGNWLLTPHPGEAAQLLGVSVAEIQQDRFAALERLLASYGGCCLLKGSGTLIGIADTETDSGQRDSQVLLCSEGNPGMGSGGMGDVLSGILAALLAQGLPNAEAIACAVCIHGEAADLEAQEFGPRGMLATDLLRRVRQLVNPRHQSQ